MISTISTMLLLTLTVLPSALAANFDVSVGASGKLLYDPEYVYAAPGDTVNFVFHPKNHTVTQSSFDAPCVPNGGFESGFTPVAAEGGGLPNFKVTVNDSITPVWVHCEQTVGTHCGKGMVFAINPPAYGNHTFAAFKALAIKLNGTATVTAPPVSTSVNCTATDTQGGTLIASSQDTTNSFFDCEYSLAGQCSYFEDGSFSSGSSTCPKQVAQTGTVVASSISTAVNCTVTDKNGGSLITSSQDATNPFFDCEYSLAGLCSYFENGSFFSGSSTCPEQVAQTVTASGLSAVSADTKLNANLADADTDEGSSVDRKTLIRNSYIVIGLLAALLLVLIVLGALTLMKGGLKGQSVARPNYVTVAKGDMESLTHAEGPRYSD